MNNSFTESTRKYNTKAEHHTHRSPPSASVVGPGDVGVDVGAAPLAAHDARGSEVHHLDLCVKGKARQFSVKKSLMGKASVGLPETNASPEQN